MEDQLFEQTMATHLQQAQAMELARIDEQLALANEVDMPLIAALMERHVDRVRDHGSRVQQRVGDLERSPGGLTHFTAVVQEPRRSRRTAAQRLRRHGARAAIADAIVDHASVCFSYLLLESEAMHSGDASSAAIAAQIRGDELAMRDELMQQWDAVMDHAITAAVDVDRLTPDVAAHGLLIEQLRDAHALERSLTLQIAHVAAKVNDPHAMARLSEHRDTTIRHGDELAQRLHQLGAAPAFMRQTRAAGGTIVHGAVTMIRLPERTELLRGLYVIEHRKLVTYAQLTSLARRTGDDRTMLLASAHVAAEHGMVSWLEHEAGRLMLTRS